MNSVRLYFTVTYLLLATSLLIAINTVLKTGVDLLIGTAPFADNRPQWATTRFYMALAKVIMTDLFLLLCMVNSLYSIFVVAAVALYKFVFSSQITITEKMELKNKFQKMAFKSLVFVFAVLNLETIFEILFWIFWLSTIQFTRLFVLLCKIRSSNQNDELHITLSRLIILLLFTVVFSLATLLISIIASITVSMPAGIFMGSETIILLLQVLKLLSRCFTGNTAQLGSAVLSDFCFSQVQIFVKILHTVHMMVYTEGLLSVINTVLATSLFKLIQKFIRNIQINFHYYSAQVVIQRHLSGIDETEASGEPINCPICLDDISVAEAAKTPCKHIFHRKCIITWFHRYLSCPLCRQDVYPKVTTARYYPEDVHMQDGYMHMCRLFVLRILDWFGSYQIDMDEGAILLDGSD